ncbi:MAG: phosphohistidine phosphatase SixA [Verrucomicrobia bacterium]|nr:phosphohistidine phosphatase SixA [Verrucomicrobiota bacterium]
MNIYLLRHGLAAVALSQKIEADRKRPLTAKGRKKMRKIAEAMKAMGLAFDLILTSPCLRAKETAAIVAKGMDAQEHIELMAELSVEAMPQAALDKLRAMHFLPENLLLVGHEPHLSGLISLLLAGSPRLRLTMKKGGLCKLSLGSLKHGRPATLEWLLTPKQILLML